MNKGISPQEAAARDCHAAEVFYGLRSDRVSAVILLTDCPEAYEAAAKGRFPNLKTVLCNKPVAGSSVEDAWCCLAGAIVENGLSPAATLIVVDRRGKQRNPDAYGPVEMAAMELLLRRGSCILSVEARRARDPGTAAAVVAAAKRLEPHWRALGYTYWADKMLTTLGGEFPAKDYPSARSLYKASDAGGTLLFSLVDGEAVEASHPRSGEINLQMASGWPGNTGIVIGSCLLVGERTQARDFRLDIPCWAPTVYLLEPIQGRWDAFAELCPELVEPASNEVIFRGAGCVADFGAHLRDTKHAAIPRMMIGCPDGTEEAIQREQNTRAARSAASLTLAKKHYATELQRSPERFFWHTSHHSSVIKHVSEDCSVALRSLGIFSHVEREHRDRDMYDMSWFPAAILEHKPTVAVAIDHLRWENGGYPPEIKHVCWIQDDMDHLARAESAAKTPADDLVCVYATTRMPFYKSVGYKRVEYLPFGYSPEKFPLQPEQETDPAVAIINNLVTTPEPHFAIGAWKQIDKIILSSAGRADVSKIVGDVVASLRLRISRDQRGALYRAALLYQRRNNLITLAREIRKCGGVAVYGAGWGETDLKDCWRGTAGKPELPAIYARHLAVLNQGLTLHPRVLECASSGGFPLIERWFDSPADTLRNGTFFGTREEMADITAKLRADPAHRQERIEALRSEVAAEHSYSARMKTLLGFLAVPPASDRV